MTNRSTSFAFAFIIAIAALASCDDSTNSSKISSQSSVLSGEKVFTGTCTAFGTETKDVSIYYVAEEDVYYPAYYYSGEGSFDFKWDKTTNRISIQECCTGLFNGFNPIDALSQEEYETTLGSEAQPSYYDPDTQTFVFNILYETADESGATYRFTDKVTFVVE